MKTLLMLLTLSYAGLMLGCAGGDSSTPSAETTSSDDHDHDHEDHDH